MATANFGWVLPVVGGSSGAWGNLLNTAITAVDTSLQAVKVTADGALQRAGGVLTGEIDIFTARYTPVDQGSMTGTVTLNLALGNFFHGVMTGSVTIAFSNVPASPDFVGIVLEVTGNGSALAWPTSVKWPGGAAPDAPADGAMNVYSMYTRDGGSTWRAALAQAASS